MGKNKNDKSICKGECGSLDLQDEYCMEGHPDNGWICTRKKGHEGKHAACSLHECNVYVWGNEDD